MVLGILSLLLFCTCINYILGVLSIIFGIVQIATCQKKGMAAVGIITSVLSIVLATLLWLGVFGSDDFWDSYNDTYYEIYDEIYGDSYDDDISSWFGEEL